MYILKYQTLAGWCLYVSRESKYSTLWNVNYEGCVLIANTLKCTRSLGFLFSLWAIMFCHAKLVKYIFGWNIMPTNIRVVSISLEVATSALDGRVRRLHLRETDTTSAYKQREGQRHHLCWFTSVFYHYVHDCHTATTTITPVFFVDSLSLFLVVSLVLSLFNSQ